MPRGGPAGQPKRVGKVRPANVAEHGPQGVDGLEQHARELLGGLQFAVAHHHENVFARVAKTFHLGQTKAARGPLDGMQVAEDLANQLEVRRIDLKSEESGIDRVERVGGFGDALGHQLFVEQEVFESLV